MSSKRKFKTGGIGWHQEAQKHQKVPFWTISFFSIMSVVCDITERKNDYLRQI